jgi:hypothetical protein
MSVESELTKEIREIRARLERLEGVYPVVYQSMVKASMAAGESIEKGNQIVELMDSLKGNLIKIVEKMNGKPM